MQKKPGKKRLFIRGTRSYYIGVTLGSLLIAGVLAITITMFFNRPRLTDKDFEVPPESANVAEDKIETSVAKKKQKAVIDIRRNQARRRPPALTIGGVPPGSKFNLTCYSYVMDRCDNLGISNDICRPMARFAAKIPAKKGMKYCRSSLEDEYPEYKKIIISKAVVKPAEAVAAKDAQAPKTQVRTAKKKAGVPGSIQIVNEDGQELREQEKKYGIIMNKNANKGNHALKSDKNTKEPEIPPEEKAKLLKEAYILMNQAHSRSLLYAESPQRRKARLLKLKALINQTKDKDLKRAYNSLAKDVTGNMDRPSGYGTEGRMSNVGTAGIDGPQGAEEPNDLKVIKEKMREAGIKPPNLNQRPLEEPAGATAAEQGTETSQGSSLPEAAGASPIQ